jgi:pimeloyl-ACP methyl ester carboxylesterase
MPVRPYRIDVAESVLTDLAERLDRARLPDAVAGAGWDYGTDLDYLRELLEHWRTHYDWRAVEARLNRGEHLMVETADEVPIHVWRQRSTSAAEAPTVVLLHGWPDAFYRFHRLVPLLHEFDVIVPSLPGYGFSGRPAERGYTSRRMGVAIAAALAELGVERYVVHGGDVGSGVAEAMAVLHPERVRGLHLTDVPYGHQLTVDRRTLDDEELAFVRRGRRWQMTDGAYALMQSTRPQSAAVGLNDSPAGLAAWIVEKYRAWGDTGGDIESRFSKDDLLTILTIYWVTETIGSSFRVYYEREQGWGAAEVGVPTGFAMFPADILDVPRRFAERFFPVTRWSQMPSGGHFAALEEPALLADDLRAFIASLGAGPG